MKNPVLFYALYRFFISSEKPSITEKGLRIFPGNANQTLRENVPAPVNIFYSGQIKTSLIFILYSPSQGFPFHMNYLILNQRRGRDSNPRYPVGGYTPIAGERFRPLSHLSKRLQI